jgi:hypothetical protein
MGIAPLSQNIRLPEIARGALQLKAGDIVSVNVIKELFSSVWAIGLKGVVFRARTDLPLAPGSTLQAQVVRNGAHIELKLLKETPSPLEATLGKAGFSAGFAQDPATLLVVSALLKSQVKIEERTVELLKQALAKMKGDPKKNARLLGLLVAKGVKPDARELAELAALLDYGGGGEGRERTGARRRRRPAPPPDAEKIAARLKEAAASDPPRAAGALSLLNHIRPPAGADNWIVAPFHIDEQACPLQGTLRFLCDESGRKIKKTVIIAHSPEGGRLQFSLLPVPGGHRLTVFSNLPRLIGAPLSLWGEHLLKLGKLGVQCDDIIVDDALDDGFEPTEGGGPFRGVDVEG